MNRALIALVLLPVLAVGIAAQTPRGDEILKRVDQNMTTATRITVARLIVHGERGGRTMEVKSWARGVDESFSEFLAPPRDKGTKMLKLRDMLWNYSPSTDRTVLISGHMLRQSMMGSDLSYEDMMEDPHLPNLYTAAVAGEETVDGRACWVLDLTAKRDDIAYYNRKAWVDKGRYVILRENLNAKSGRLLKTVVVREVMKVRGHWLAKNVLYKDVLKEGDGTEFIIDDITLDATIPASVFSKGNLKR